MTVQLSVSTQKKLRQISKKFKIQESEILDRAVAHYLFVIDMKDGFQKEIQAWDTLSDDDFLHFEQNLG